MKRFCFLLLLGFASQSLPAQSTIFLVRHAEKADASTSADPNDPELSDAGRARAESLAKLLRDAGLTAIYATEYKRTQQTAEPIAQAAGVKTTIVPAQETASFVAKLKKTTGNVLAVGHSNTLPEILKTLGVSDSVKIGEGDYDDLFVILDSSLPRLIHLHSP